VRNAGLLQADKKAFDDVAAGLPRHTGAVFIAEWRRKAASASPFTSLAEPIQHALKSFSDK
jgi:hypothetical protein